MDPVSTGARMSVDDRLHRRAAWPPASGAVAGPSTWNSRRLPWSATRCSTSACAPDQLSADTTSTPRCAVSPATTTTGTRLASRATTGGGTTPSPISRPSTLPDSASRRDSTGPSSGSVAPLFSSSRRKVISSDQDAP